jgi:APA family basic amino acid/polyamine antiporter
MLLKPMSKMSAKTAPGAESASLVRGLRLPDATAVVIGTIIGSGIFLVPSNVSRQLPSLAAVLLLWVVGGVLTFFGALALSELGAAFPGAGGLYVYLRLAYGDAAGFLYGWALLSMIHTGSIATLAVAFGLYLAPLLGVSAGAGRAMAVGTVALLTAVNCLGVRAGKLVQNIFTTAKLGGLVTLAVVLLAHGHRSILAGSLHSGVPSGRLVIPFGVALVAVLWAYEGWHVVSFVAGEVEAPARNLPRSLALGTASTALVYILANIAYYSVLPREGIAASQRVAAAAMTEVMGPAAGTAISLLIITSIFGAINGMVLTGPRVYWAMANDGLFFRSFARLSPRYRTPVIALLFQGAWSCALTLMGSFQQLFTYVIFTAWIFYGMTVAAVIVLRRRQPNQHRPFRCPGYPVVPALFALAALGIFISTIVADGKHAAIGIALVLAGCPLYAFFRARSRASSGVRPAAAAAVEVE